MALPNGLPHVSDLGDLLGLLKNDLVDLTYVAAPFTSISNRALVADLSNDLGVRMGVDRIPVQAVYKLNGEQGPNGQQVFAAHNDLFNQIRFVGSWTNLNDTYGQRVFSQTVNDFIEVTFYGTGLNILLGADAQASRDYRVTIDGGSEGANFFTGAYSTVLYPRNYSVNSPFNIASGLTVGMHTVKIRIAAINMFVYGFEILNESSSIRVNPGSVWKDGKKLYNSAQSVSAYNSGFESGTLGTRGGCVSVYIKPDGSVAKAVQPTESVAGSILAGSNTTNHTNEQIIKTVHFREFGAGRTDDFSLNMFSNSDRFFTLDDGTTTLHVNDVNTDVAGLKEGIVLAQTANSAITITFVGTGLDIFQVHTSAPASPFPTVFIDNVNTASGASVNWGTARWVPIVSGLPYGTHTVKITQAVGGTGLRISEFRIYAPKKPTIPTGAVELGSYFILGNYSFGVTDSHDDLSDGVIWKAAAREAIYTGTWSIATNDTYTTAGVLVQNSGGSAGDTMEYTFFGTGFEWVYTNAGTGTYTLQIDGVAYTGAGTATAGSWTPGTSTLSITGAGALSITGLALGKHTLRFTKTSTGGNYGVSVGISIITPIHFPKENGPHTLQNTLSVGSQSVGDSRVTYNHLRAKKTVLATGVLGTPGISFTAATPMTDMATTINSVGKYLKINWEADVLSTGGSIVVNIKVYVDGIPQGNTARYVIEPNTTPVSKSFLVPVTVGHHRVDLYWWLDSGTAQINALQRQLTVEDVN